MYALHAARKVNELVFSVERVASKQNRAKPNNIHKSNQFLPFRFILPGFESDFEEFVRVYTERVLLLFLGKKQMRRK